MFDASEDLIDTDRVSGLFQRGDILSHVCFLVVLVPPSGHVTACREFSFVPCTFLVRATRRLLPRFSGLHRAHMLWDCTILYAAAEAQYFSLQALKQKSIFQTVATTVWVVVVPIVECTNPYNKTLISSYGLCVVAYVSYTICSSKIIDYLVPSLFACISDKLHVRKGCLVIMKMCWNRRNSPVAQRKTLLVLLVQVGVLSIDSVKIS